MTNMGIHDELRPSPRRWIGICVGLLLLATFIIPWGIYGGTKQWSWMLFQTGKPSPARLMLQGVWGIGFLVFLTGILAKKSWLAAIYLVTGIVGVALYLIGTRASTVPWRVLISIPLKHGFPVVVGIALFGWFLIMTGVRRPGIRPTARLVVIQRIAAGTMAIVLLLSLFAEVRDARHPGITSQSATGSIGISLVAGWIALMGCWLAFGDGRVSGHAGRRLLLAAMAVKVVWSILRPAIDAGNPGLILGSLNNMILLVGVTTLAISGLTGCIADADARRKPDSSSIDSAHFLSRGWLNGAVAMLVAIVIGAVAYGASRTLPPIRVRTAFVPPARIGDWSQWCGGSDRNMVSGEKGLPVTFDEVSNAKDSNLTNVKWVVKLSHQTLGSPIVHRGKVFVGGTGQDGTGLLWCFAETDGKLLWRMQLPYITDLYNRSFGITSTPTAEDDKLYLVTHLGDVLCLSTEGMHGGNRGPFTDEAQYFATGRRVTKADLAADGTRLIEMTPGDPATLADSDADILWRFDMIRQVNCWPYNAVNPGIVLRGNDLFVATGSTYTTNKDGESITLRDWKARNKTETYPSPSLIALDKNTGKLLAVENEGIFGQTFHGAHSSPALAMVNGKQLLVYGGGNGTCYAFDPNFDRTASSKPAELKLVWKFDCTDPATYNSGFSAERPARSEIIATPVIYKDRVYIATGNDLVNSGHEAKPGRLLCLDATMTGEVTRSAKLWSFDEMRSSASTVAIADGLLYAADASGMIYCLDAETGKLYWTHSTEAAVWSSPLVADGKVYVPIHNGGLLVFAQGKEKKLLAHVMGNKDIVASPAAANGVLYIASQRNLYALKQGSHGGLTVHEE